MSGPSGSLARLLLLFFIPWLNLASAQDILPEGQSPNSQLWKSFQLEIKTLEEAAHRVNTLLSNAVASQPTPEKKAFDNNPTEKKLDVTVFTNPDSIQNGILKETKQPKIKEVEKDQDADKGGVSSDLKPSRPTHLNLGSIINSFGFFKTLPEPWWKGDNVCIEQSEKEEKPNGAEEGNKHFLIKGTGTFEHCKQTPGKYICTSVVSTPKSTKTVSTTYQCCEGFRRQGNGCVQGEEISTKQLPVDSYSREHISHKHTVDHINRVNSGEDGSFSSQSEEAKVKLKSAVEVLDSLECKDFASLLKSQNSNSAPLADNFTMFAPIDKAMKEYEYHKEFTGASVRQTRAIEEWNEISPLTREDLAATTFKDILLAHITDSLLDTDDFTNEMVVKSLNNETTLRINIYPGREEPVVTVNCGRIMSADNLATHARVHTIDRRLTPVTQTLMDILSQPQFSKFKKYLEQESLLETLINSTAMTVFAPTNEAWDRLSSEITDKYSRGELCIKKVLRHHILPLTLCSAPMSEGRISTSNLNNEMVRLKRNDDGQIVIDNDGEDVKVVQEDIVTKNGVVHVLESVLTPRTAKSLSEWLSSLNCTNWLALLDKAGLIKELDGMENITMLVPQEKALAEPTIWSWLESLDKDHLRQVTKQVNRPDPSRYEQPLSVTAFVDHHVLLYHVTEKVQSCELDKQVTLKSQNGQNLHFTTMNSYSLFSGVEPQPFVQCVLLSHTDGQACNAVAHELTNVLLPPNSTTLEIISENPDLSVYKQIMEGTAIEKDVAEKSDGFTMLVPNDDAFNKLDEDLLSKLLSDKKFADEVLRMHILKGNVCCSSVTSVPWPFTNSVTTMDNKNINVSRDRRNNVIFGNAGTERCDIIGTDGIVHIIDNVLLPESRNTKLGNVEFGTPEGTIMLFGI